MAKGKNEEIESSNKVEVEVEGSEAEDVSEDKIIINKFLGEHETDVQAKKTTEVKTQDRVTIIIHNQDGPGGNHAVFVAVNGVGYNIPREIPTSIPVAVLHALENATETRYYREVEDGKEFGPMLAREVRRFPFSKV